MGPRVPGLDRNIPVRFHWKSPNTVTQTSRHRVRECPQHKTCQNDIRDRHERRHEGYTRGDRIGGEPILTIADNEAAVA